NDKSSRYDSMAFCIRFMLAAILVWSTEATGEDTAAICHTIYAKLSLSDLSKLNPTQVETFTKATAVFEKSIADRLVELPEDLRAQVIEKLKNIRVIDYMDGHTRAVTLDHSGKVRFGETGAAVFEVKPGDLFLNNNELKSNLYGLITIRHELEHIIDLV